MNEWSGIANNIATYIPFKDNAKAYRTESDYNKSFEMSKEIILADKKKMYQVEIADLIYFDETNKKIFLFHNKVGFDGSSTRDLLNQINVSSALLSNYRFSVQSDGFFREYYRNLSNGQCVNIDKIIDENDFVSMFKDSANQIVYVANYMEEVRIGTKSMYTKAILNSQKDELRKVDMGFIVTNK